HHGRARAARAHGTGGAEGRWLASTLRCGGEARTWGRTGGADRGGRTGGRTGRRTGRRRPVDGREPTARLLHPAATEAHTGKRGPYRPVRLASPPRADVRRRLPVRQLPRRAAWALRPHAPRVRGRRDRPAALRD